MIIHQFQHLCLFQAPKKSTNIKATVYQFVDMGGIMFFSKYLTNQVDHIGLLNYPLKGVLPFKIEKNMR